jgi:hypothetical protein
MKVVTLIELSESPIETSLMLVVIWVIIASVSPTRMISMVPAFSSRLANNSVAEVFVVRGKMTDRVQMILVIFVISMGWENEIICLLFS